MTRSQTRLVEQTPFLRYSREEIEFFHLLVRQHREEINRTGLCGPFTSGQCIDLMAKLQDDLKMRP